MSNFEKIKIKHILKKIPRQKKIKKSNYTKSGKIPIIDQGEDYISGYTDDLDYKYDGELPVVIFGDHTRRFKWVPFSFASGGDGTKILSPHEDIDIKFFYYNLLNLKLKNYGYSRHFKYLKEKEIFKPNKPLQIKISDILSQYDELIFNNNHRVMFLDEISKRIYEEWFVYCRYPGYKNDEFFISEYGKIPKKWKYEKLGEVLNLEYGEGLRKSDRIKGDYPVYGSSGVIDYHNDFLVSSPCIIVGRKGNVGSVYWSHNDCNPIDTVYYVKTDLSPYYVYFNLLNQNFIDSHAAVPGLNRNQAYNLHFLVPSKDVIFKFEEIIKPIFDFKYKLEQKNNLLREVRDFLLPKLISGTIDVSDLDIEV